MKQKKSTEIPAGRLTSVTSCEQRRCTPCRGKVMPAEREVDFWSDFKKQKDSSK